MIPRVSDLLQPGEKIAVAVSGGADSMCLLHLCIAEGLSPVALHVDHGIRGEEAERDEKAVADYCKSQGVTLYTHCVDVPALAKGSGISLELAGRQARYNFFDTFVSQGYTVLTAHNANDNLETMLYNLSRQSGLAGMAGIPMRVGGYLRPLLYTTREQILSYCEANSVAYVTDSTNLRDDYTRNFIRHHIVPALQQVNPAAVENAALTAKNLRCDEQYLQSLVPDELLQGDELDTRGVDDLPLPVQTRLFAAYLKKVGLPICRVNIEGLQSLVQGGVQFDAVGGKTLSRTRQRIGIKGESAPKMNASPLSLGNKYLYLDQNLVFFLKDRANVQNLDFFIALDYDKISGCLMIRSRKEGDKITLAGRGVTKTLKKLFNEKGIRPEHRNAYPVLCDDLGVVAVAGLCVDARVEITDNTKIILVGEVSKS